MTQQKKAEALKDEDLEKVQGGAKPMMALMAAPMAIPNNPKDGKGWIDVLSSKDAGEKKSGDKKNDGTWTTGDFNGDD